MVTKNFTDDPNSRQIVDLDCSAGLTGSIYNQLIFLSVLNILLSIVAFLGNTLILVTLRKESSLHPPSKLLFSSLATTDLFVGVIVEPLEVINWISVLREKWSICRHTYAASFITGYMLCTVSLLTLTAISVDRLLALLLGLRYRQVVTLKRTKASIIVFWVVSLVATAFSFWNNVILSLCIYTGVSLCLVTSTYTHTKIFLTLRHRRYQVQNSVQGQPNQTIPLNIARYRKTVSSVLWVQLALLICYVPHIAVKVLTNHSTPTSAIYLARQGVTTLIYLNSSLNPILYCWKIRDVRQAAKETIRQMFCSWS